MANPGFKTTWFLNLVGATNKLVWHVRSCLAIIRYWYVMPSNISVLLIQNIKHISNDNPEPHDSVYTPPLQTFIAWGNVLFICHWLLLGFFEICPSVSLIEFSNLLFYIAACLGVVFIVASDSDPSGYHFRNSNKDIDFPSLVQSLATNNDDYNSSKTNYYNKSQFYQVVFARKFGDYIEGSS